MPQITVELEKKKIDLNNESRGNGREREAMRGEWSIN
jgi:hypothetical protein